VFAKGVRCHRLRLHTLGNDPPTKSPSTSSADVTRARRLTPPSPMGSPISRTATTNRSPIVVTLDPRTGRVRCDPEPDPISERIELGLVPDDGLGRPEAALIEILSAQRQGLISAAKCLQAVSIVHEADGNLLLDDAGIIAVDEPMGPVPHGTWTRDGQRLIIEAVRIATGSLLRFGEHPERWPLTQVELIELASRGQYQIFEHQDLSPAAIANHLPNLNPWRRRTLIMGISRVERLTDHPAIQSAMRRVAIDPETAPHDHRWILGAIRGPLDPATIAALSPAARFGSAISAASEAIGPRTRAFTPSESRSKHALASLTDLAAGLKWGEIHDGLHPADEPYSVVAFALTEAPTPELAGKLGQTFDQEHHFAQLYRTFTTREAADEILDPTLQVAVCESAHAIGLPEGPPVASLAAALLLLDQPNLLVLFESLVLSAQAPAAKAGVYCPQGAPLLADALLIASRRFRLHVSGLKTGGGSGTFWGRDSQAWYVSPHAPVLLCHLWGLTTPEHDMAHPLTASGVLKDLRDPLEIAAVAPATFAELLRGRSTLSGQRRSG
jgi:hypothetical protein